MKDVREKLERWSKDVANVCKTVDAFKASIETLLEPREESNALDPVDAILDNYSQFSVGQTVQLSQDKTGCIKQLYLRHISKILDDEIVSKEGKPEDPALLIIDDAGVKYLLLASEVSLVKRP